MKWERRKKVEKIIEMGWNWNANKTAHGEQLVVVIYWKWKLLKIFSSLRFWMTIMQMLFNALSPAVMCGVASICDAHTLRVSQWAIIHQYMTSSPRYNFFTIEPSSEPSVVLVVVFVGDTKILCIRCGKWYLMG